MGYSLKYSFLYIGTINMFNVYANLYNKLFFCYANYSSL